MVILLLASLQPCTSDIRQFQIPPNDNSPWRVYFHAGPQRKEKIVKKLGQPDFANKSGQLAVWYRIAFYFIGGWQIPLWLLQLMLPGERRQEL